MRQKIVITEIDFYAGYFNSTLNPIIYVMTNQEFKIAFTTIVCRIFCCRLVSQVRQRDHELDFTRFGNISWNFKILKNFFQLTKQ